MYSFLYIIIILEIIMTAAEIDKLIQSKINVRKNDEEFSEIISHSIIKVLLLKIRIRSYIPIINPDVNSKNNIDVDVLIKFII